MKLEREALVRHQYVAAWGIYRTSPLLRMMLCCRCLAVGASFLFAPGLQIFLIPFAIGELALFGIQVSRGQ